MKHLWAARLCAGTLCLALLWTAPGLSILTAARGEETAAPDVLEDPQATVGTDEGTQADTARYVATATVALKVRREPATDAFGNGSVAQGETVSILELGNEWTKVDLGRNQGYVQTKYLTDIRQVSESGGTDVTLTALPTTTPAPDVSANTPEGFRELFKAYAYKSVVARKEMSEKSASAFRVNKYEGVTVSANQNGWSYIRYKNSYGYVPTDSLFKWDRIDAYAGDIPGCVKHAGLAFVNHSTEIRSYANNGKEVLKTINPGSALSVDALDGQGRYPLPYWRTTGYVQQSDVGYVIPVVPWEDAQSGDLISCMSTFYAVGIHTLNYQGRNWNIYLGSSFISGLVMQPGETVNIYDIMGPYRKSTGYHRAPIMSAGALWGYGGGTCQVNTTLYNALIQVPILVNWRKVHAEVGIYYCPVGFDAAVGGGDITMIFTNELPYAVRFNYFMSDGCLTVGIFRV